ncbi:calsyntenin-1-like, partial [Tropilaelaps mercedesae]
GTLTTLLGVDQTSPSAAKSGASRAPTQDRGNENSAIYFFDGKTNALLLPRDTFHQTDTMAVQFWMKHEQNLDKKAKEHVVCTSDSHKMNRHHFSVFLHNCHLVLLVRKHNSNYHKLFPAEFRWRVSEVCDFEWHHYTINLAANGGDHQATLFIDGRPAEQAADIVDDWPIHRNVHVGNETTTVVGACWQAKQSHMAMHFKGYLSDLVILNNATEPESVLKCMYHCKESLVRTNSAGSGSNSGNTNDPNNGLVGGSSDSEEALSDVEALSGDSVESIERQISRLAYRNSRRQPTPGNRLVQLNTHVKCTNGQSKRLPMVETIIAVKSSDSGQFSDSGEQTARVSISSEEHNIAREYGPIKEGVDIFETINIKVQQAGENIDSCTIQVFPALNPDHETLQVPEYVLDKMGLSMDDSSATSNSGQATQSGGTAHQENQQIRLRGPAPAENFQKVISGISYLNKKPAYYLNRAFKLQCYEMANRFASNEYIQTLTVIHPSAIISASSSGNHGNGNHGNGAGPVAAKLMQDKQSAHSGGNNKHHGPQHLRNNGSKHSNSSSIGIAGVVVAGLVVTVLAMLAVVRRHRRERSSSAANGQNGGQLAWDDSALTITVNPLSSEDWDPHGCHGNGGLANGCHGNMASHDNMADMMAMDDSSGDSSCADSDDSDDEGTSPGSGSGGSHKHLVN